MSPKEVSRWPLFGTFSSALGKENGQIRKMGCLQSDGNLSYAMTRLSETQTEMLQKKKVANRLPAIKLRLVQFSPPHSTSTCALVNADLPVTGTRTGAVLAFSEDYKMREGWGAGGPNLLTCPQWHLRRRQSVQWLARSRCSVKLC